MLAAAIAVVVANASAVASVETPQSPANLPVTSCADSGPGTLRAVVASAQSGDTVSLNQLPCPNKTITLTSGAVPINVAPLTITAGGNRDIDRKASLRIDNAIDALGALATIDGNGASRIFDQGGPGTLTLSDFTMRHGHAEGPGGCLRSLGDVFMVDMVVTGCSAHAAAFNTGVGGGVYVEGNLSLQSSAVTNNAVTSVDVVRGGGVFVSNDLDMGRSTISGNTATAAADGFGGGLYAKGNVSMSYSTISGNGATTVGGADLLGGGGASLLVIVNSTISGNSGAIGGMLALQAPLYMASSTIAFNTSTETDGVGGLALGNSSFINSTIIAKNNGTNGAIDIARRCGPAGCLLYVQGSNNLFGTASLFVPGDTISSDALLQPLANNGGLTQTHRLSEHSPAINHGNAQGAGTGALFFDQRGTGYTRIAGVSADIGAFEFGGEPDCIFVDDFEFRPLARVPGILPLVCP